MLSQKKANCLLSSFGQSRATVLLRLTEGLFSRDQITDFLTRSAYNGKGLWKEVKPLVRQIELPNGVLVVNDSIIHNPLIIVKVLTHFDKLKTYPQTWPQVTLR